MNILILNGNPDKTNKKFDRYIEALEDELSGRGHKIQNMLLRDMDIRHCTGCWSCWWKTPGICMHHDDMPSVYRSLLSVDLMFYASPVIMGFVSALLKRTSERLIPLLHPYFAMREGEWHHKGRYERYPAFGIILGKTDDTDDEDIAIISDIYRRQAVNFLTILSHSFTTDRSVKEACDAIGAL